MYCFYISEDQKAISPRSYLSDRNNIKTSSSDQKGMRSSAGFHSLSAPTGDICNPNITNNVCVLLSRKDKAAVCAHLSPEQTFFFFTSCAPLVTCLVVAVKIKVSAHGHRRRKAWRISQTLLLFFFCVCVCVFFQVVFFSELFPIAPKQDVWTKAFTWLWRVFSSAIKYWCALSGFGSSLSWRPHIYARHERMLQSCLLTNRVNY